MKLLVFVLNKEELLEDVLTAYVEAGIPGATILDSEGMGRFLTYEVPLFADFKDFMKGFTTHVGSSQPISLKKHGIKWQYCLPSYNDEEVEFIKSVVFDLFYQCGFVATGKYNDEDCFAITSYGKLSLFE